MGGPPKQHPQGQSRQITLEQVGGWEPGLPVHKSTVPADLQEAAAAQVSEKVLPPPRLWCPASPAHLQSHSPRPPAPRLPAGGKAVNTAPVPSQTPHDESDRRTEPRSSVSDLVNSLTSEMLMVRRPRGLGGRVCGNWGQCGATHSGRGASVMTSSFTRAGSPALGSSPVR